MTEGVRMDVKCNDGGRRDAGYEGEAGDCAVRAVAIANNQSYQVVYDALNVFCKAEKRKKKRSSSRTGVHRDTLDKYMKSIGWSWVPTMIFGKGCRVHLVGEELPAGRLVVRVSSHLPAVSDGVVHDI